MSEKNFKVLTHTIPGQHLREYPSTTSKSLEDVLRIEIKQYIPLGYEPQPGDATIIATHANGMIKELYEPLWDTLLERSRTAGLSIRGIWVADVSSQGGSGVINEQLLGNEVHWFDHARDLLRMVDVFRHEMPAPIVGVGHSMGAAQLTFLSAMHPALFSNIIFIEPQMVDFPSPWNKFVPLHLAVAAQPDLWSSRKEAAEWARSAPWSKGWDPRVINRYIETSFRETPTLLYPNAPLGSLTRRTTKHQEKFSLSRPNFEGVSIDGQKPNIKERKTHPDVKAGTPFQYPFYLPAQYQAFHLLPNLRPAVLFIHGSKGPSSDPKLREKRLQVTGIETGGSGGAGLGRSKDVTLEGGHWLPFDRIELVADEVVKYLKPELELWKRHDDERKREWEKVSLVEKQKMSAEVIRQIKELPKTAKKDVEITKSHPKKVNAKESKL